MTELGLQDTVPPAGGLDAVVMVNTGVKVSLNAAKEGGPSGNWKTLFTATGAGAPTQTNPAGAVGRESWLTAQLLGACDCVSDVAVPEAAIGVVPVPLVKLNVSAGGG